MDFIIDKQPNQETINAMQDARNAGFDNISADVMSGIPRQTTESYLQTLDRLCALSPEHISGYLLKIEEGTPFGRMADRLPLPDEDETVAMYADTLEALSAAGYAQYEISNFAKKGRECRHNIKYWHCEEYLGIGASAHSFVNGKRFYYARSIDDFINGIPPVDDGFGGDEEEYIMLALRLSEGLVLEKFRSRFDKDVPEETIKKAVSKNANRPVKKSPK